MVALKAAHMISHDFAVIKDNDPLGINTNQNHSPGGTRNNAVFVAIMVRRDAKPDKALRRNLAWSLHLRVRSSREPDQSTVVSHRGLWRSSTNFPRSLFCAFLFRACRFDSEQQEPSVAEGRINPRQNGGGLSSARSPGILMPRGDFFLFGLQLG